MQSQFSKKYRFTDPISLLMLGFIHGIILPLAISLIPRPYGTIVGVIDALSFVLILIITYQKYKAYLHIIRSYLDQVRARKNKVEKF